MPRIEPFNPISAGSRMPAFLGRTAFISEAERERAFIDLSPYHNGMITLGKFSGSSAWERHPKGDEVLQILDGEIVLRIEHDSVRMLAGDMIVIPADCWHQIYAPCLASILYITPRPTVHFEGGDPMGRQFDPLSGRGAWLLEALIRAWFWVSRK